MAHLASPFLDAGTHATAYSLATLQLRRDHLIPAVLAPDGESDYAEGKVENTRFGSFPHSTLVGQPWGTQVLASLVDTGSRAKSKKRKRDGPPTKDEHAEETGGVAQKRQKEQKALVKAAAASSGFAHLLPPTPETWTLSLPHRTQVVYTPDYSFILQRLRARPGDHIIEAGAGSGSFTHAAVRAVFNGYPGAEAANHDNTNGEECDEIQTSAVGLESRTRRKRRSRRHGGVYSYEYHEPRANQLRAEIAQHGLAPLVTVTHRDVYADGFGFENDSASPDADIIFLDLPAPWQALPHLARSSSADSSSATQKPFRSPLNPRNAVRICTFSPCIEQVTKTVAALRAHGWLSITMSQVSAKRLEVRRERIGLAEEGLRGGNASPATVAEAVQRLRDVEGRAAVFHSLQKEKQQEVMRKAEARKKGQDPSTDAVPKPRTMGAVPPSKQERVDRSKQDLDSRTLFNEGRVVHRTEPELKTHTSYLVFAVLPRQWSAQDEEKAQRKWGPKSSVELS